MNSQRFIDLAKLSISSPRDAALEIMSMRLKRDFLWLALVLAAALNALLFCGVQILTEPNPDLPSVARSPLAMFLIIALALVATVHAVFWTGKAIGGEGVFDDLLGLFVWIQALRVVVQATTIILFLAVPLLSGLFSLVAGLWLIAVTGFFISAALNFSSPWRGVLVLVLASGGLTLSIVVLATVVVLSLVGVTGNV